MPDIINNQCILLAEVRISHKKEYLINKSYNSDINEFPNDINNTHFMSVHFKWPVRHLEYTPCWI